MQGAVHIIASMYKVSDRRLASLDDAQGVTEAMRLHCRAFSVQKEKPIYSEQLPVLVRILLIWTDMVQYRLLPGIYPLSTRLHPAFLNPTVIFGFDFDKALVLLGNPSSAVQNCPLSPSTDRVIFLDYCHQPIVQSPFRCTELSQ